MNLTRLLTGGFLLAITFQASAAAPVTPERNAVLHAVQTLLDGWRNADAGALEKTLHPGFREVTLHFEDGKWNFAIEDRERLIHTMTMISKGAWDDRLLDPEVRVDGPIAVVWSHYKFVVNHIDKGVIVSSSSHCGVETFQLYTTDAGWQIVNFADTHANVCQ